MNAFAQKYCGECGHPISASLMPPPPSVPATRSEPSFAPPPSQRKLSNEHRLRFPLPLVGRDDDLAWLEQRRNDARTRTIAFSDGLAKLTADRAPLLRPLRSAGLQA